MNVEELIIYQQGFNDGAEKQKQETAANVFAYIVDNGELIPEEQCLQILSDFLKDKNYNKTVEQKNNKKLKLGACDKIPRECIIFNADGFCSDNCPGKQRTT